MTRFRKKPVVIAAVQFLGCAERAGYPIFTGCDDPWLREALAKAPHEPGSIKANVDGSLFVMTLEGVHKADVNDWIIRGVKGELYPCKPDIFELTYEIA